MIDLDDPPIEVLFCFRRAGSFGYIPAHLGTCTFLVFNKDISQPQKKDMVRCPIIRQPEVRRCRLWDPTENGTDPRLWSKTFVSATRPGCEVRTLRRGVLPLRSGQNVEAFELEEAKRGNCNSSRSLCFVTLASSKWPFRVGIT